MKKLRRAIRSRLKEVIQRNLKEPVQQQKQKYVTLWRQTVTPKIDLIKTVNEGYKTYEQTGSTPVQAFYGMRQLYVLTNGRFNDFKHWQFARKNPPFPMDLTQPTVFGKLSPADIRKAAAQANRDGFYIFPQKLSANWIEELTQFALSTPCQPICELKEGEPRHPLVRFDPANPIAPRYDMPHASLAQNRLVQKLMCDPGVLALVQQYFGSRALFTNLCMWWSTPVGDDHSRHYAAQMYHFDMDRTKFVNLYFYLSDVNSEAGPHTYVRGSCKRKPKTLLKDRRFEDDEILQHYRPSDIVEITAPKGSIFMVDTRGFHKGKKPVNQNRLMLQLTFATDLFGMTYDRVPITPEDPDLKAMMVKYPFIYSNYIVQND